MHPPIAVSGVLLCVKRWGQGPSHHSSISPVGPQEGGTGNCQVEWGEGRPGPFSATVPLAPGSAET